MGTFNNISDDEFRKSASEFFRATQDRSSITPDQAENGHKALTLLYFGHDESWTDHQINSAVIVLELAAKRVFEVHYAKIANK